MTAAVAVDLGKTGCRAVLWNDGAGPAPDVHEVPGAPGLAADHGVELARTAVRAAVLPLLEGQPHLRLASVCVGAAGAAAAPEAARERSQGVGQGAQVLGMQNVVAYDPRFGVRHVLE
ncbi:hypothetical protein ACWEP2_44245, partial [Streptomyces sp. NPDC004279]